MIFTIISIAVPVGFYFLLPWVLEFFSGKRRTGRGTLFWAGVCFFVSWYLPSPLVQGQQTAFVTHFVGGGLFCGFVWVYIKDHLRLNWNWFFDLLAIYFLAAGLGVVNELFELVLYQVFGFRGLLTPSDTWWDLLANTLGVVSFWVVYNIYKLAKK